MKSDSAIIENRVPVLGEEIDAAVASTADFTELDAYAPPQTPSLLRMLDYLYLTRPILFFPGWTTLLAGYFSAVAYQSSLPALAIAWQGDAITGRLGLMLIAFAAAMGASFILNQLKDLHTDRENHKLFFLGEGMISQKSAYIETGILLLLALILGAFLHLRVLAILSLFVLVTGYLYNYPPLQMKNFPVRGLLANMAMGWLAFVAGWAMLDEFSVEMVEISLPFLLYNSGLYLLTTIPDADGDRATGKTTIAVKLGTVATIWLSNALFVGTSLSGFWLGSTFFAAVSLLILPFMVIATVSRKVEHVIVAVKMGIFFFSLAICVKFPPLLAIILGAFFLTRYYYRKRFDLDYPSFKGN